MKMNEPARPGGLLSRILAAKRRQVDELKCAALPDPPGILHVYATPNDPAFI